MQKIINVLAVLSFAGVASIVGGGTYLYLQRDAILDGVKAEVTEAAVDAVTGALPGMMDSAMPEMPKMPSATGPALPF